MCAIKGINLASRNLKINLKNMTPREIGILNNSSEFLNKEAEQFHISISKKQSKHKEGLKIEVSGKSVFGRVISSLGLVKGKKNARTDVKRWSDEKFIEHFKSQLERAEEDCLKIERKKSVITDDSGDKVITRTKNGQIAKQINVNARDNTIKIYNPTTKTEEYRRYLSNGNIFKEKTTIDGVVVKDFQNLASGKIEKTYDPATKTEEYKNYYSNGKVSQEKTTIDGVQVKNLENYKDGSPWIAITYDPATKIRKMRCSDSNHKMHYECVTVDGRASKYSWFDENGVLINKYQPAETEMINTSIQYLHYPYDVDAHLIKMIKEHSFDYKLRTETEYFSNNRLREKIVKDNNDNTIYFEEHCKSGYIYQIKTYDPISGRKEWTQYYCDSNDVAWKIVEENDITISTTYYDRDARQIDNKPDIFPARLKSDDGGSYFDDLLKGIYD